MASTTALAKEAARESRVERRDIRRMYARGRETVNLELVLPACPRESKKTAVVASVGKHGEPVR
jgi:hypothetical protein